MLLFVLACWKNITGEIAMEAAQQPISFVQQEISGPVSWVDLTARAGAAHDPIGKEGLAYITARLLLEGGTKMRSAAEVDSAFSVLGASPSVHVDMEMVSFRLKYLQEDAAMALELFGELLSEPAWDELQFQRIKNDAKQYLSKDVQASDERLGHLVFQNWLYEGHPYGHPIQGRTGVIDQITLRDVMQFYQNRYVRSSMVLGAASHDGVADQTAIQLHEKLTGVLPVKIYQNVSPKRVPPVQSRQILLVEKETDSTGILFGHPTTLSRDHPDWPAMLIAINILGAHRQSFGVLYQELRTERGLNYGDYAYLEMYRQASGSKTMDSAIGRLQNPFYVWLRPVSEDNGPFALRASLAIVEDFVSNGVSEEQLHTMQRYLSGQVALWGKDGGRQIGWEVEAQLMGWDNPLESLPQKIQQVTLQQINEAIVTHLDPATLKIVVITGDAEKFKASIEEDVSLVVYDGQEVEPDSEQGQEDELWAKYPIDSDQQFQRTSKEIFQ